MHTQPSYETSDAAKALLQGAVDLHCHSGPSAMPRILDHYDAFEQANALDFAALVYKDHYYPGMAHAEILQDRYPDFKTRIFSGVALNNATGGINRYTVDHCVKLGGKIVWMPTFSAKNHIDKYKAKNDAAMKFPSTREKMVEPIPLTILDDNGRLTDETLACLDLIAAGDIILAGGHLHVTEQVLMFEEAKKRGCTKMIINHPTYLIDCTEEDMRSFASMGVYMEHAIGMLIPVGRGATYSPEETKKLIDAAGVDQTILCSDLGLTGAPVPVDGYKMVVEILMKLQYTEAEIKKLISTNSASLLNLDVN